MDKKLSFNDVEINPDGFHIDGVKVQGLLRVNVESLGEEKISTITLKFDARVQGLDCGEVKK